MSLKWPWNDVTPAAMKISSIQILVTNMILQQKETWPFPSLGGKVQGPRVQASSQKLNAGMSKWDRRQHEGASLSYNCDSVSQSKLAAIIRTQL